MDFKDYYVSLGVSPDADDKTIKKAYQKLAKKYHPDVNPGDAVAETKFKEATEAYQAISDPEKRRKYDELRQDYQQWKTRGGRGNYNWDRWQSNPGGGGRQGHTMSPEDFAEMFGGSGRSGGFSSMGGDDFSDFFSTIFGGGGGQGRGFASGSTGVRARAGQDHETEIIITLEESYHGTTRVVRTEEKQIEAKIPKGVVTGSKVRLTGQGGPGIAGGARGNLYLNIKVSPHPRFEREGDNLSVKIPIDFYQAILGGEVRVSTFSGEVLLKIPPLTQSGKKFRLKGKGMPNRKQPSQQGDLFAELVIVLPEGMSEEEITTLRDLADRRRITEEIKEA